MHVHNVQLKVARGVVKPVKTLEDLQTFLAKWWCRYYKKPYKSVELDDYTLEELLYEYFDVYYHNNPEELQKFLHGESKEAEADEDWLKDMMNQEGAEYISKEQQEEMLQEMKDEIEAVSSKDPDDLHFDFGDLD